MGFNAPDPSQQAFQPLPSPKGAADTTTSDTPLVVGGVVFYSQEHPQNLELGLEQILAVHDYVGGSRVIQAMGPRPKDITWDAKWRGSQTYVDGQNRMLLGLTKAGKTVTTSWSTYAYDTLIAEYIPNWKHVFRNDFKITLRVLRDKSGTYGQSQGSDVNTQIQQLYNTSNSSLNSLVTNYPTVQVTPQQTSLLSTIGTGLAALGQALSTGILSGGLAGGAGTTQSILSSLLPALQSYIGTLGSGSPAQMLIDAQTLYATVALIQKNISVGQAAAIIVVFGGSLYDVAAQYYGNPNYAQAIAAAQSPPLLTLTLAPSQPTTLVLPPIGSLGRS